MKEVILEALTLRAKRDVLMAAVRSALLVMTSTLELETILSAKALKIASPALALVTFAAPLTKAVA